jgi:hypothetical protein
VVVGVAGGFAFGLVLFAHESILSGEEAKTEDLSCEYRL